MRFARALLAISLALLLAATSQTMAVARGQARVAGDVVICSGYGITTISVDENGDPVGPAHICPDMVLALMAALGHTPVSLLRPDGAVAVVAQVNIPLGQGRLLPATAARDPPQMSADLPLI